MPLSSLQSRVLRLLATHRNSESYVAGASSLALDGARYSRDIGLFQDRELAMQDASDDYPALLEQSGIVVEWVRRLATIRTAWIRPGDDGTLLEWVVDSAYRFFPALQDELFGYVLHPADFATNKALAAVGRREPRDIVDLLDIHDRWLRLGAVVWAASAKDPGFSPEGLIAEIGRYGRYQQSEYDRLQMETPIDAGVISRSLKAALSEADTFVRSMPGGLEGLLFLDAEGRPVQARPRLPRPLRHPRRAAARPLAIVARHQPRHDGMPPPEVLSRSRERQHQ